jgi:Phage integrase, N-terminal SAM-like domain
MSSGEPASLPTDVKDIVAMCGACASDDLLYKYAYTLCSPQTRRIILPTSRQDPAKNSPYNRAPSERSAVGRTAVEDFVHHLTRAERSPLTIKNYRCDLAAFARWFRDTTGDELTPALITPTDLRDYKRFLVDHRRLKPSSVNRQLPLNAEARCALMVLGYAAHAGSNAPVLMGQRGRMTPSGVQRLLRA